MHLNETNPNVGFLRSVRSANQREWVPDPGFQRTFVRGALRLGNWLLKPRSEILNQCPRQCTCLTELMRWIALASCLATESPTRTFLKPPLMTGSLPFSGWRPFPGEPGPGYFLGGCLQHMICKLGFTQFALSGSAVGNPWRGNKGSRGLGTTPLPSQLIADDETSTAHIGVEENQGFHIYIYTYILYKYIYIYIHYTSMHTYIYIYFLYYMYIYIYISRLTSGIFVQIRASCTYGWVTWACVFSWFGRCAQGVNYHIWRNALPTFGAFLDVSFAAESSLFAGRISRKMKRWRLPKMERSVNQKEVESNPGF